MIKRYNLTLDEDVVNKAKENMEKYGSKLSPLINQWLKDWNKAENKKEEGNKK